MRLEKKREVYSRLQERNEDKGMEGYGDESEVEE